MNTCPSHPNISRSTNSKYRYCLPSLTTKGKRMVTCMPSHICTSPHTSICRCGSGVSLSCSPIISTPSFIARDAGEMCKSSAAVITSASVSVERTPAASASRVAAPLTPIYHSFLVICTILATATSCSRHNSTICSCPSFKHDKPYTARLPSNISPKAIKDKAERSSHPNNSMSTPYQ